MSSTFTVFFDDPFWAGVLEVVDEAARPRRRARAREKARARRRGR